MQESNNKKQKVQALNCIPSDYIWYEEYTLNRQDEKQKNEKENDIHAQTHNREERNMTCCLKIISPM